LKVRGLDVVAAGIIQATAVGYGYHLKNVQDFAHAHDTKTPLYWPRRKKPP
jgi:hypothetical protein